MNLADKGRGEVESMSSARQAYGNQDLREKGREAVVDSESALYDDTIPRSVQRSS